MHITPELVCHKVLEDEVRDYLEGREYWTHASTYHSVMPEDMKRRLSRLFTPTSLYIRGRADRLAIHKTKPVIFEWEAKTHPSRYRHDMTLEALPICHHLAQSALGVRCLYTYRDEDPQHRYECGFWVDQLPRLPIRVLMIPDRWTPDLLEFFRITFPKFFPKVPVLEVPANAGSGDPFFIIDESVVARLDHWHQLIDGASLPF